MFSVLRTCFWLFVGSLPGIALAQSNSVPESDYEAAGFVFGYSFQLPGLAFNQAEQSTILDAFDRALQWEPPSEAIQAALDTINSYLNQRLAASEAGEPFEGATDAQLEAVAYRITQGYILDLLLPTASERAELVNGLNQSFEVEGEIENFEAEQDRVVSFVIDRFEAAQVAFLEEQRVQPTVGDGEDGLAYEIFVEGDGLRPGRADRVRVHYRGSFVSGREFDSSYSRGEPTEFPMDGVIEGFAAGLEKIREGGEAVVYIPSNLGYGESGTQGIPGGSTLVFTIELIEVTEEGNPFVGGEASEEWRLSPFGWTGEPSAGGSYPWLYADALEEWVYLVRVSDGFFFYGNNSQQWYFSTDRLEGFVYAFGNDDDTSGWRKVF
jgi:FKBP-type peptidyl-prolyl cis-trans isomerase